MKVKYALAIGANIHDGRRKHIELEHNTTCIVSSLNEFLDTSKVAHWKEWLGSIAWKRMTGRGRVYLATKETVRAEVLDDENVRLLSRVNRIWIARLFCSSFTFNGSSWDFITGSGEISHDGKLRLLDVRSHEHRNGVPNPFFVSRDKLWGVLFRNEPDIWDELPEIDNLLDFDHRGIKCPQLLHFSIQAYLLALEQPQLEFRVPLLVRAAEGVIAVSRRNVKTQFVQRAKLILETHGLGPLADFINLPSELDRLYDVRSECVHGKLPFSCEIDAGEGGADNAALLEYVAHLLARTALKLALRSQGAIAMMTDRDALEKSWASDEFPKALKLL